jgi:hypothetical protein
LRKIYLFAIGMIAAQATEAQITYEFNDLPVIGDQIIRYRDTMTVYGPGPAGAGQQWLFPAPVQHETVTTSVVSVASTPHAAQFLGSNLAMTNDNSAYLFFDVNSTEMISTGAAGDLLQNGGNIVSVFNPALTVHEFPRTYESTGDHEYYFEVITTDHGIPLVHSVRLRHYGHVFDTTDGYGQITTPVGTYECLRVKSTDFTVDSVWIKLFSFSQWALQEDFTGPGESTSYSWLAKETKLAVAELSFDSIGNPKNFTWSSIPPIVAPTTIADASETDVRIYPQPAHGAFTVDIPQGGFSAAELMTLDGRTVRSQTILDRDRLDVDIHGVAPGMYILRLLPVNGSTVTTRKVIVQ